MVVVLRLGFALVLAGLALPLFGCKSLWIFDQTYYLISTACLAIHEVGHLVARPFGETIYVLGGTLAQIFVSVAVIISAARLRRRCSFAFGWFFLASNLIEIGRYVADARARELVILSLGLWPNQPGQGPHDWHFLLSRWGALAHDLQVADVFSRLGVVAFGLSLVALLVPRSWLPLQSASSRLLAVPPASSFNAPALPPSEALQPVLQSPDACRLSQ